MNQVHSKIAYFSPLFKEVNLVFRYLALVSLYERLKPLCIHCCSLRIVKANSFSHKRKKESYWAFMIQSFVAFRSLLFMYTPAQNRVLVCQGDKDENEMFSGVWSNYGLNGFSIFLLIDFPQIRIHMYRRKKTAETKMWQSVEMEKCESCCYFILKMNSEWRGPCSLLL